MVREIKYLLRLLVKIQNFLLSIDQCKRMKDLCHAVGGWLEDMGIVYWLEGGTLLGAVRENGTLLQWEDDVDVSVALDNDLAWDALVAGVGGDPQEHFSPAHWQLV